MPLCEACHGKVHNREFVSHTRLIKRALAKKKARNEKLGGLSPYGTKAVEGILVPEDGEQLVITTAHELRDSGLSLRAVTSELAARGVVGRTGRPLGLTQVTRMLRVAKEQAA